MIQEESSHLIVVILNILFIGSGGAVGARKGQRVFLPQPPGRILHPYIGILGFD